MRSAIILFTAFIGSAFASGEPLKVAVSPKGNAFSFEPCLWHLESLLTKRDYYSFADSLEPQFGPPEASKHYDYRKTLRSGLAMVSIEKTDSPAFSVLVDVSSNSKEALAHQNQIVGDIVRVLRSYYGFDNVKLEQPLGKIAS